MLETAPAGRPLGMDGGPVVNPSASVMSPAAHDARVVMIVAWGLTGSALAAAELIARIARHAIDHLSGAPAAEHWLITITAVALSLQARFVTVAVHSLRRTGERRLHQLVRARRTRWAAAAPLYLCCLVGAPRRVMRRARFAAAAALGILLATELAGSAWTGALAAAALVVILIEAAHAITRFILSAYRRRIRGRHACRPTLS